MMKEVQNKKRSPYLVIWHKEEIVVLTSVMTNQQRICGSVMSGDQSTKENMLSYDIFLRSFDMFL